YETGPDELFPALYDELSFLVRRCGMSPEQVLRSATLIGARGAGAEDLMGSVEVGKLANFVVLEDDPLSDIEHLRSITLTVKRGRRFPRRDFDAPRDLDALRDSDARGDLDARGDFDALRDFERTASRAERPTQVPSSEAEEPGATHRAEETR
ncbi:amidohydrolase family protein, partial [Streptomyces sp. NPDC057757]|uniref:amidohydrolase family protein n=1 Tax=Streptomyces sp. NPDC057757 TaxID=3346241 RepID=UPI0036AA8AFA